jgi:hypothetical protein
MTDTEFYNLIDDLAEKAISEGPVTQTQVIESLRILADALDIAEDR